MSEKVHNKSSLFYSWPGIFLLKNRFVEKQFQKKLLWAVVNSTISDYDNVTHVRCRFVRHDNLIQYVSSRLIFRKTTCCKAYILDLPYHIGLTGLWSWLSCWIHTVTVTSCSPPICRDNNSVQRVGLHPDVYLSKIMGGGYWTAKVPDFWHNV